MTDGKDRFYDSNHDKARVEWMLKMLRLLAPEWTFNLYSVGLDNPNTLHSVKYVTEVDGPINFVHIDYNTNELSPHFLKELARYRKSTST